MRVPTLLRPVFVLVCAALLVSCGGQAGESSASDPIGSTAPAATTSAASVAPSPAATSDAATAPAATAENVDLADWNSVLVAARGQTVNWYIWGGSESINTFVDTFYGVALQERYGVTLNRVPIADTVDAVNQVLSEKEAGQDPGAVDLIWINGENFRSLKQADMLYAGWNRALPNSQYVNWDNPALNLDFGEPIDTLESPWSSAQFQFIYDTARTSEADLPRSYAALQAYACANPGRVTYVAPGPGAFQGTRFVKQALYEISGGAEQWLGPFDQALWDRWSPELWRYLNDLKPCLWRDGATYPKDENELHSLFANQEVDFSMTQAIAGPGPLIEEGLIPATSRTFVFTDNMIGDYNYVAIPANAPNKAAALVLANLLLEPEFQAAQIVPENGFGLGYGIDVTNIDDPIAQQQLEAAAQKLGPAATPADQLAEALVGDIVADYQGLIEQAWQTNVLQDN